MILHGEREPWVTSGDAREGGEAEVYEARGGGRRVAAKVVKGLWRGRVDLHAEAARLREIAAELGDPPWLVRVLDQGLAEDGRPFYVMPWYEHSLATLLDAVAVDGGLDLLSRLDLAIQAADAVVGLHRAGRRDQRVAHRDIKPGNLLVERAAGRWRVVLADFGIARRSDLFDEGTSTIAYSRRFAAPEQRLPIAEGRRPTVDVFSVAVLVFLLVTGDVVSPRVASEAGQWFTDDGRELEALHLRRRRSTSEEARYQALVAMPTDQLISRGEEAVLSDSERARLRSALVDGVIGSVVVVEAERLAGRVVGRLVGALERALEPDPVERQANAEALRRVLIESYNHLAVAMEMRAWTPIEVTAPVEAAPVVMTRTRVALVDEGETQWGGSGPGVVDEGGVAWGPASVVVDVPARVSSAEIGGPAGFVGGSANVASVGRAEGGSAAAKSPAVGASGAPEAAAEIGRPAGLTGGLVNVATAGLAEGGSVAAKSPAVGASGAPEAAAEIGRPPAEIARGSKNVASAGLAEEGSEAAKSPAAGGGSDVLVRGRVEEALVADGGFGEVAAAGTDLGRAVGVRRRSEGAAASVGSGWRGVGLVAALVTLVGAWALWPAPELHEVAPAPAPVEVLPEVVGSPEVVAPAAAEVPAPPPVPPPGAASPVVRKQDPRPVVPEVKPEPKPPVPAVVEPVAPPPVERPEPCVQLVVYRSRVGEQVGLKPDKLGHSAEVRACTSQVVYAVLDGAPKAFQLRLMWQGEQVAWELEGERPHGAVAPGARVALDWGGSLGWILR